MVLHHVADDAGAVVVASAVLDVDLLRDRDLDIVDVVAIPYRLEDRVGESKDEQVLYCLFAEVVVDSKDL